MRTLFLILILYISWASCEEISKKDFETRPKRRKHERIHIINSRRYMKPESEADRIVKLKPKKTATGQEAYTAFPHVGSNVADLDVPDSPYFPHDPAFDQKTRVKKVLPDYAPLQRKKRSDAASHNPGADSTNKEVKRKDKKKKHNKKPRRSRKDRAGKKNGKTKSSNKKKKLKKGTKSGNRTDKGSDRFKAHRARHGAGLPGASGRDGRRLIASRDALIEDYPYVVSIQKNGQHWCAGSLLNPRLIITTANCLWKSPTTSRMRVRAGSRYIDRGGQVANIAQVMRHPGWGIRREPDNDVALALLDKNIRFSDSVHAVDLPNRFMIPAFDDAWVASWGAVRRDGIFEDKTVNLQAYYARLLSRPKCNNMTMRFGVRVTENFICLSQTGRQSPCTRDTGAPAVSDGVLWGMASWGIRKLCGTERFPAVFSYVGSNSNMDFIINATRYLMADERFEPFLERLPMMPVANIGPLTTELPY